MVQNVMSDECLKKQAKIMCPHALFLQAQSQLLILKHSNRMVRFQAYLNFEIMILRITLFF